MIEIRAGTRVVGTQLPIQTGTRRFFHEWERDAGPAELARIARAADRAGYFYVTTCDHIVIPDALVPTMSSHWQACVATLTWLAGQTEHTNLLSNVYVLPFRHPLVAAKEFATLDWLSGGRAIVGVGAGHVEAEFAALGVDHAARGRITEEKLPPLLRALEHESVDGLHAQPRPVQQPRPPVWVGGSSAAAIRRAGTYADGWLPQGPADDEKIARLHEVRAAHGRDHLPFAVGHIVAPVHLGGAGSSAGRSSQASWPEGTITGTGESVADQILAATPAGVNQLQVYVRSASAEDHCDQLERFAAEVLPLLVTV
jgi:alkanesulfonate monooxygenase SsuD/methylene tetrahydromethanopterin reductase-like flavin-dependent oxidoreductase (luciferase family)